LGNEGIRHVSKLLKRSKGGKRCSERITYDAEDDALVPGGGGGGRDRGDGSGNEAHDIFGVVGELTEVLTQVAWTEIGGDAREVP